METLVQGVIGILVLLGTGTCVARSPVNRVEGQIRPVVSGLESTEHRLAADDIELQHTRTNREEFESNEGLV